MTACSRRQRLQLWLIYIKRPHQGVILKSWGGEKSSDVKHLHLVLLMLLLHSAMSEFLFSVDLRAVISDYMTSMTALSCDTKHLSYSTNWHSTLHLGAFYGVIVAFLQMVPFLLNVCFLPISVALGNQHLALCWDQNINSRFDLSKSCSFIRENSTFATPNMARQRPPI